MQNPVNITRGNNQYRRRLAGHPQSHLKDLYVFVPTADSYPSPIDTAPPDIVPPSPDSTRGSVQQMLSELNNPHCPSDILEYAALNGSVIDRLIVVDHPRCPTYILNLLSNDSDSQVASLARLQLADA